MKRFTGAMLVVTASVLVLGASQAFGATTRIVGACGGGVYPTIQSGINASAAGDTVKVCAGTYVEQVAISGAGKNNLTLQSMNPQTATIQAPASMSSPKAIVRVTGSTGVTVKNFIIQGPGGGSCDSLEYGVRVDGGGVATVQANLITHIRDTPFGGCQNGVAIQAGRSQESTAGEVIAKNNTITDYQKNGVTVSGSGSEGQINGNTIIGAGSTPTIAQNGIQFSSGGFGSATNNDVSGNVYQPATTTSTGVLVFGPVGPITVGNNTLHGNDVSVYAYGGGGPLDTIVTSNTISGSTWDGITVDSSIGAFGPTVTGNTISGGDQGIGVYGSSNALVKSNSSSGAHTNGIFADSGTVSNRFRSNTVTGVTGAGHYACRDDSGSGSPLNTWTGNTGSPSLPSGICT